jgi:hypothetical protein
MSQVFPPKSYLQTFDLKPKPPIHVALRFDHDHSFLSLFKLESDKRKQTSWTASAGLASYNTKGESLIT